MTISAGTVSIGVRPAVEGFSTLMHSALQGETGAFASMGKEIGGKIAAGIGASLVAVGALSVKMAMDMQTSDAKIQGNAQLTAKAAAGIGDAFLKTAGQSTFSGKEMADSFAPVAGVIQSIAGHTLKQSEALLTMKAATTLAEASGKTLASTTADLASVMQGFGMKLSGASEAANILFNASRLTNVDLDTLSGTVVKLHGKLGLAAPTLSDIASLMVDLANHGVSGSKGLMVVNSAMGTLLGGSKATTDALKILGMNVWDSSGKFVGMKNVLSELTPKLAGMTDQQRLATLTVLMGKTAASALNSTIMAGADGYAKATAAVTAHNAAQMAADAIANTLKGKMEKLHASFNDIVTLIGEAMIPKIEALVSWFGKHKVIAEVLAGIVGGVLVGSMAVWLVATVTQTAALLAQAAALALAYAPITLIVAIIGGFVAATVWAYKNIKIFHDGVNSAVNGVLKVFQYMTNGVISAINLLIRAWNLVPWHKDIKTLTNVEFPQLASAAESAAAKVNAALNKSAYAHPTRVAKDLHSSVIAPTIAALPSVPISSNFAGAVAAAVGGAKKVLSAHAKIVAQLVKDHLAVTKIYGQMHTVIADALKSKADLIKGAAGQDASAQASYNDAAFNLNRTFNQDKFKLDRDYLDKKNTLHRTYDEAIASATKTFDDTTKADQIKHNDALLANQKTYNDKVATLTQDSVTKQLSIIQKSKDLLTGAFSGATSLDVGSMFSSGTGVSGLLDSLKAKLDGAKTLASNAASLAAKGFSQTFIQQVVGQGSDIGNQMSDAILNATPEASAQLKDLYGQMQDVSDNGLNKLADQMNSGTKLATSALTAEYAQVAVDLKDSLAGAYTDLGLANAAENAAFMVSTAANLKTLDDAKASALLTLNNGLTDAAKTYSDSLFDMNTTLSNGLFDARKALNDSIAATAKQFDTDIQNLQDSTTAKMATLQTSLKATADLIAKISGASVGASVISKAPKMPSLVTAPSSGSLDMATSAQRANALSSVYVPQSTYDSQVPKAAGDPVLAGQIADAIAAPLTKALNDQARTTQMLNRAG